MRGLRTISMDFLSSHVGHDDDLSQEGRDVLNFPSREVLSSVMKSLLLLIAAM